VRVLTVCTGNICRSPAVELLLASELAAHAGDPVITVASAGTAAVVGAPVSAPMAALLTEVDVPSDGFAARQVTPHDLRSSDLVVALTREHRTAAVQLEPSIVRRTFTLLELARIAAAIDPDELGDGAPAARLAALVALAGPRRGVLRAAEPQDDDVADPYGRGDAAYRASFDRLRPAVTVIARAVARA